MGYETRDINGDGITDIIQKLDIDGDGECDVELIDARPATVKTKIRGNSYAAPFVVGQQVGKKFAQSKKSKD